MQIHNHLHSSSVASGYAESRVSSVAGIAELTNNLDAESAGNPRFPALNNTDEIEKSKSQDRRDRGSNAATTEERENSTAPKTQKEAQDKQKLEQERQEIVELAARDREVRAHEQAHVAVGGRYAGSASYRYERGPDGVNYATSGEVSISTSREPTPQATLQKAQVIRRAALAPAEPSPQDRSVAAKASSMETEARKEIALEQRRTESERSETSTESKENNVGADKAVEKSGGVATEVSAPTGIVVDNNIRSTTSAAQPLLPGSVGGRLFQSISNSTLSSREPGSILDQIA